MHGVEFYKSAFGAIEVYRVDDPGGAVVAVVATCYIRRYF